MSYQAVLCAVEQFYCVLVNKNRKQKKKNAIKILQNLNCFRLFFFEFDEIWLRYFYYMCIWMMNECKHTSWWHHSIYYVVLLCCVLLGHWLTGSIRKSGQKVKEGRFYIGNVRLHVVLSIAVVISGDGHGSTSLEKLIKIWY